MAGSGDTGYLAQHPLLEQIPELRADVQQPEYCALGEGRLQSVNAWFGPAGTVRRHPEPQPCQLLSEHSLGLSPLPEPTPSSFFAVGQPFEAIYQKHKVEGWRDQWG